MRRSRYTIILDGPPSDAELEGLRGLAVREQDGNTVVVGVGHEPAVLVGTMARIEAHGRRVLGFRLDPEDELG